jgi:fructose-bisphosphate aldolase, class II
MRADDARRVVAEAREARWALAAFNVNNMETAQAVVAAAEDAGTPVMLQISPGAIDFAGWEAIVAIAFGEAERASVPVLVHLDHCRDPELVRRAIGEGFSSVMFDGSALRFDENVATTTALVEAAHARGIAVEAELGEIGGIESTTLEEALRDLTDPDEAAAFVRATGVDILAPAMGTLHRMPNESVVLDRERIAAIASATGCALALHGASGVQQDQLRDAIAAGVTKINISSRVGRAFAAGIRRTWEEDPQQLDLRRYLGAGRTHVQELAARYLELCGAPSNGRPGRRDWSAESEEPE